MKVHAAETELAFLQELLEMDGDGNGDIEKIRQPYDIAVSPDDGFVYVASFGKAAISYFERSAEDGLLNYLGDIDNDDIGEDVLKTVRSLAISPNGKFLYAISMLAGSSAQTGGALSVFSRNAASGELEFLDVIYDTDLGVDGLKGARSLSLSPDGKFLYAAAFDEGKVSVFSLNAQTGAALFQAVYVQGDQGVEYLSEPHALSVSPDGTQLIVALYSNRLVAFDRDASTGLLTYQSSVEYLQSESSKETLRALQFSPDGDFLYVASYTNDAVSVFSRDASEGTFELVADYFNEVDDVELLDGPYDLVVSPDGGYVYVAAFNSDAVVSFRRDVETGELSFYKSIAATSSDEWSMNGPVSIAKSYDGESVYVGTSSGTHGIVTLANETVVDPPEFVVQPVDRSIEEGGTVGFYGMAQGLGVSYQWYRGTSSIAGETGPVLSLLDIASSDDGAEFSLKATNSGGTVTSDVAVLTVLPPVEVEAPVDLTALDISSSTARLSWKDQSDNETGFVVQRRVLGDGDEETSSAFATVATVSADTTEYEDEGLDASTEYRYRVAAKRVEVYSNWSNNAAIESYDEIPKAPENLVVQSESYNKVTIRWSDRSAVEDGYSIERRDDEAESAWSEIATLDANKGSFVDREVVGSSTYAYRVRAFNESGNSEYSNSVVAQTSENPVQSISPTDATVDSAASSGHAVSVVGSSNWEAVSDNDWLIVTNPTDGLGSGNGTVIYRVGLNESQGERIGVVTIGGVDHTVTQEGSDPFLRLASDSASVSAVTTKATISVQSNEAWSVTEDAEWVSIKSGSSGENYGTVTLQLLANESTESRTANVSVNDVVFTLEQRGVATYLDVSVDSASFSSEGGSGVLTILSNMEWSVSESVDWIQLDDASLTGNGDTEIVFSVSENGTESTRSTVLYVNDVSIVIEQEGNVVLRPSSDVTAPSWGSADVSSGRGVELLWTDNSETESGFLLERSLYGSDEFEEIGSVDANTTRFFDRSAPRGVRLTYRIYAYDEVGFSKGVDIDTDVTPDAYFGSILSGISVDTGCSLFYSNLKAEGTGEMIVTLAASGNGVSGLLWNGGTRASIYAMDTANGIRPYRVGEADDPDWQARYLMDSLPVSTGTNETARSLLYGYQLSEEGGAYPRGLTSLGSLGSETDIWIGFEVVGGYGLPILLRGIGPGVARLGIANDGIDPKLTVYRLGTDSVWTEVFGNDDWSTANNDDGTVSLEDALAKAGREDFALADSECQLLLDLEEGKYVAVLSTGSAGSGLGRLEVFDVR